VEDFAAASRVLERKFYVCKLAGRCGFETAAPWLFSGRHEPFSQEYF